MDRPKKVNAALLFLHGFHDDISYEGWLEVVEDYMKSLETKAQCLDEIIAYMKDDTVTWRDISDDIINDILKDHDLK